VGWSPITFDPLSGCQQPAVATAPGGGPARRRVRASLTRTTDNDRPEDRVDLLFAYRARRVAKTYINEAITPTRCAKASADRGCPRQITSDRARTTIASQLDNAKEPMTLLELQAWLGHRSPRTTQYHAKITPVTLAKAYNDGGYFSRNVRTIESCSTATPSPQAPPRPANRGSTTTWATVSAPTRFSSSARTEGLRPLRPLRAQGLHESPAAGSQDQPATDDGDDPVHRRRTRRRRR
jgi:hypothetical protein